MAFAHKPYKQCFFSFAVSVNTTPSPPPKLEQQPQIHRFVTGTGIMGGDVEGFGGKRSHSAFSGMRFFPDEAFLIPHTCVGVVWGAF